MMYFVCTEGAWGLRCDLKYAAVSVYVTSPRDAGKCVAASVAPCGVTTGVPGALNTCHAALELGEPCLFAKRPDRACKLLCSCCCMPGDLCPGQAQAAEGQKHDIC